MLSSVLNSEVAIQANIRIIRVFTRMRNMLAEHKEILAKLENLERKIFRHDLKHSKHEEEIQLLFRTMKQLLVTPRPERKRIGFRRESETSFLR